MTEPHEVMHGGASAQRANDSSMLDRAVRESLGGRIASGAARTTARAWRSSALRATLMPLAIGWREMSIADRVRAGSIGGAVAMIVAGAMMFLQPRGIDPLSMVLPGFVLAMCVLAAAASEPLARALERIRR